MTESPIEKLTAPDDVDWFPGSSVAQFILGGDLLSISGVVNQIIDTITGWNAVESVTSNFGGDWKGLRKSVDAFRNLAEYNNAYAASVKASTEYFSTSWQGNAATSAVEYFDALCTALENQAAALNKLADEINLFAEASYLMIQAMNNIVQMIVDLAIILIASIIAYGTGIGAAASAVSAAISASMIAKVAAAMKLIGESLVIAEGVLGLILTGLAAAQGEDKRTQLPSLGKSYNHSAV
ncbi:hypothetical protein [Nocardia bhagyanarayanae]|uniref:Type VII secretion system (Wss) protein ESAT-6 n=1 Tax=Nocardia bhagyanarayanae TaxID=1215925 RepID=A0A543F6D4_9NOCA|nr:hypothetical protein [Nocardia bhagyanarayanae]TQM29394.1 hypothetical protein FB390_0995 [Nocardia bhagyanarayanae]